LIGTLPDGTYVKERSSFVVILDRLPAGYAEAIRSIPTHSMDDKQVAQMWPNRVRRAKGDFYTIVPDLLSHDQFDVAVPISTTVVAFNDTLAEKLLSEEAKHARWKRIHTLGKTAAAMPFFDANIADWD
jgi:hypothetical protein